MQSTRIEVRWSFRRETGDQQPPPFPFKPTSWFKKLDRISVRLFDLNLPTTGASFHLVAEAKPRLPQRGHEGWGICPFNTSRFQPADACCCPSGIGREPDAPGPLSRICASPSDTLSNAESCWGFTVKPRCRAQKATVRATSFTWYRTPWTL
jgi:hypothetical protein